MIIYFQIERSWAIGLFKFSIVAKQQNYFSFISLGDWCCVGALRFSIRKDLEPEKCGDFTKFGK